MPTLFEELAQQPSSSVNLFDKAVCLTLTLTVLGNSRKLRPEQVEVDAEKDRIRAGKKLLECEEYDAIKELDTSIRHYVYARSLPSPLKSGTFLLPIASIEEVDVKLHEFRQARRALVNKFIDVYPQRIEEAEQALRSVFDPTDYKAAGEAKRHFGMAWQYCTFGTPSTLKSISADLFKREQEKAAALWTAAGEEIRQLLRVQMAELVNHAVDRLSGGEDGKPKVFRDTLVSNVSEFLATFEARNLTEDGELQKLVADARKLLEGVSPEILRKSADVRSTVSTGMARIKEQLDTMLVDRPSRAIEFED